LQSYSRENDGYKIASEKMFGKEIDLHIAMQQIMEYDPWIDELLTVVEK